MDDLLKCPPVSHALFAVFVRLFSLVSTGVEALGLGVQLGKPSFRAWSLQEQVWTVLIWSPSPWFPSGVSSQVLNELK